MEQAVRTAYTSDAVFEADCELLYGEGLWSASVVASSCVTRPGERCAQPEPSSTSRANVPPMLPLPGTCAVPYALRYLARPRLAEEPGRRLYRLQPDFRRVLRRPRVRHRRAHRLRLRPRRSGGLFRDRDRSAITARHPLSNREWVRFASDGRQALLDTIKTPMLDGDGRLIRVLGIGRDITADHQTQAALAQRVKVPRCTRYFGRPSAPTATSRPCCAGSSLLGAGMRHAETFAGGHSLRRDSYGASLPADVPALAIPFDGEAGLLRIVRRRGSDVEDFDADERAYVERDRRAADGPSNARPTQPRCAIVKKSSVPSSGRRATASSSSIPRPSASSSSTPLPATVSAIPRPVRPPDAA